MNIIQKKLLTEENPYLLFKIYKEELENTKIIDFKITSEKNQLLENKVFGTYSIQGVSNYSNAKYLDSNSVITEKNELKIVYCIDFDTNVVSRLKKMFFEGEIDEDLFSLLIFIKKNGFQTSCGPYMLECGLNFHSLDTIKTFESFQAFYLFDCMEFKTLEDRDFANWKYEKYEESKIEADKQWRIVVELDKMKNEIQHDRFYIIYSLLLATYYIKYSNKIANNKKINQLIEFTNKELGMYSELEFNICCDYINNVKNPNTSFFNSISPGAKNILRKIQGMAWDFTHIRNLELEMKNRNSYKGTWYLHSLATRDKGLNRILEYNPVERIIFYSGNIQLKRKYSSVKKLTPEFIEKIAMYTSYRKELTENKKIDYRQLSQKYSEKVIEIIERSDR